MSGEPPGWRHKTQVQAGAGLTIEVWELDRKACRPIGPDLWTSATSELAAIRTVHAATVPVAYRQVCLRLAGGGALLEPGAFQYARGSISAELQKNASPAGGLARRVTTAATGEAAYTIRLSGDGEIWTQPSEKHFVTMSMAGPEDALLLDAGAFYACESSIEVGTHVAGSVQGLVSGSGLLRPRLSGCGVLIIESPVPPSEIEVIVLDGHDTLTVSGDVMLACSASLEVTLEPLVRGTTNAMRSAETLVYTLRGQGKVMLMPTRSLGY